MPDQENIIGGDPYNLGSSPAYNVHMADSPDNPLGLDSGERVFGWETETDWKIRTDWETGTGLVWLATAQPSSHVWSPRVPVSPWAAPVRSPRVPVRSPRVPVRSPRVLGWCEPVSEFGTGSEW